MKMAIRFLILFLIVMLLLIFSLQSWITMKTESHIYSEIDLLPEANAAIILGTSRYLQNGKSNPFYTGRINAGAQLYKAGKVKHLLVSGDNQYENYNEPRMMAQDLIKREVPSSAITYDFAGFRTLDSVVRAHTVFGLDRFTIITQSFHCERAILIAQANHIEANCFATGNPKNSFSVKFREFFARLNAFLDLYLLNTQPKFDGPPEPILLIES